DLLLPGKWNTAAGAVEWMNANPPAPPFDPPLFSLGAGITTVATLIMAPRSIVAVCHGDMRSVSRNWSRIAPPSDPRRHERHRTQAAAHCDRPGTQEPRHTGRPVGVYVY